MRHREARALVRAWRRLADDIDGPDDDDEEPVDLSEEAQQEAITLRVCADQLEAIIR